MPSPYEKKKKEVVIFGMKKDDPRIKEKERKSVDELIRKRKRYFPRRHHLSRQDEYPPIVAREVQAAHCKA